MILGGYILKFGNKSFKQLPFNEVDGVLFAYLAYPNWGLYVTNINEDKQKDFTLCEINELNIKPLVKGTPTAREHKILLRAITKTNRYKDVKVKYIEEKFDYKKKQQYFAVTFEIPGVGHYVAYRGTDLSILGWEENFQLALNIVTNSQSDSLKYLEKVGELVEGNIIVGGHSKGGNLAMYSSIYAPKELQDRITQVYSLDGPGFYDDSFYEKEEYKRIEKRILQFIPRDSFVGVIFNTPKEYKIIASRNISAAQHFVHSWRIKKDGTFKYKKTRTYMSLVRQRALVKWLENAPFDTKILTIDSMVTALGGNDKDILLYLKHPWLIGKTIFVWFKKYNKEQKKIIFKFSNQLVKAYFCSFFHFLKKKNRLAVK